MIDSFVVDDPIHDMDPEVSARMLYLVDFEDMFSRTVNPIIVNDPSLTMVDFAKQVANKLFVENENGIIDHVASCECGATTQNNKVGTICPVCGKVVKVDFVTNKNHRTWIAIPDMIKGVLHPVIYKNLQTLSSYTVRPSTVGDFTPSKINSGKFCLFDGIVNPAIPLPKEFAATFPGRGFNYLYDNYDKIIHFLLHDYKTTATKRQTLEYGKFLKKYRKLTFTTKLPVLAAILQPVNKKSDTMRYVDVGSRDLLLAVHELSYAEFTKHRIPTTEAKLNSVLADAYQAYNTYTTYIVKTMLGSKQAIIRHHSISGRLHFSYRSVIVPISGEHRYDELHIPWSMAVQTFTLHILNRLEKVYGMRTMEALDRIKVAVNMTDRSEYDQDIYDIMCKLLLEYPGGMGFPSLFNRPPTLRRGGEQLLFVTQVKLPGDNSIGISPLVITESNSDRVEYTQGPSR